MAGRGSRLIGGGLHSELLRADHLRVGRRVHDVSVEVHAGEIVGLAGLLDAAELDPPTDPPNAGPASRLREGEPGAELHASTVDLAHRFGITHHRGKRSKRIIRTELEDIPGIGPETAKKLLTKFGSIKGIKEAPTEEVVAEIGAGKAQVLLGTLNATPEPG